MMSRSHGRGVGSHRARLAVLGGALLASVASGSCSHLGADAQSNDADAGSSDAPLADADARLDPSTGDGAFDSAGDANVARDGSATDPTSEGVRTDALPAPSPEPPAGPPALPGPSVTRSESALATPSRAQAPQIGEVHFQRIGAGDLSNHAVVNPFARRDIGYGYGGGLVDVDGDFDLDLLVGNAYGTEPDACFFLNRSEPGAIRFDRESGWCYPAGARVLGGIAMDVESDGRDEAIVFGVGIVLLERFFPERATLDLLAIPGTAIDGTCIAGAALPVDFELDGDLDVLVSCRAELGEDVDFDVPVAWTQSDGSFVPAELPEDSPFRQASNALGYGAIDADRNGLIDVVALEDSFSSVDRRNVLWPPGAWYLRCVPGSSCDWRLQSFFNDSTRFGSFMGAGNIRVEGFGERLYLADWSVNRMLPYPPAEPINFAPSLGIGLGWEGDEMLFSWGVVVDDLDGNGTDDLFISQGDIGYRRARQGRKHYDVAFLQSPDGAFTRIGAGAGLALHSFGGHMGLPESSRSCAKADFDANGALDLFLAQLDGAPIVYTTHTVPEPESPRCTLVPRDRYVPVSGYGHAVAGADGIFVRRDMQGQHQLGASPWVLTSESRGELRFASGASVAFDCDGAPGPVVVEEPDWLAIEWTSDAVSATVDPVGLSIAPTPDRFALLRADADSTVVPADDSSGGTWTGAAGEDVVAVMISIDGNWVGRWFPRP